MIFIPSWCACVCVCVLGFVLTNEHLKAHGTSRTQFSKLWHVLSLPEENGGMVKHLTDVGGGGRCRGVSHCTVNTFWRSRQRKREQVKSLTPRPTRQRWWSAVHSAVEDAIPHWVLQSQQTLVYIIHQWHNFLVSLSLSPFWIKSTWRLTSTETVGLVRDGGGGWRCVCVCVCVCVCMFWLMDACKYTLHTVYETQHR